MNTRTCQTVEDPSTYSVVELNCLYEGKGDTLFEGPSSIRRVTIDRLTEESIIIILGDLHEFFVLTGKPDLCSLISVPKSTIVKIGSAYCPEMFSKILSTSSNDGYSSSRITNMVTASDVDKSSTSTAETPTSDMFTSYSTNWETKKEQTTTDAVPWVVSTVVSIADRVELLIISVMSLVFGVYRLVELIMRINNAPPAFPLQNLILPPQRAQLQPPQAVQLPTLRRSGRRTTTPNRLNFKDFFVGKLKAIRQESDKCIIEKLTASCTEFTNKCTAEADKLKLELYNELNSGSESGNKAITEFNDELLKLKNKWTEEYRTSVNRINSKPGNTTKFNRDRNRHYYNRHESTGKLNRRR
ncbi:unnamed protein product [Mytilus coruscus]|uniref:Uncharacterized protein n=1 Tax=Mytilus coruscus TaxID=42192 RepID=A0A6J8AI90_MYTCO|nr:unnamed protein product [Mytilus coruscus]